MIIISYDISDDRKRNRFAKMITKHGAIRLQFSVYELRNTQRITDNLITLIESFARHFDASDNVMLFDVNHDKIKKYGRAIHLDQPVVYF